jgi:four helix bundle protein
MSERKPLYRSPGQPGRRGFEDLECYKLALHVSVAVQGFIKELPPEERYDMAVQVRRSSKSVTANIAEGYDRFHYLDSLYKYSIARGELNETLSHVINAKVLGYIEQPMFEELYALIRETEQTLNGYMAYVQRQRAGSKEYGDKSMRENEMNYSVNDAMDDPGNTNQ